MHCILPPSPAVITLFNPQNVNTGSLAMDCISHHTRWNGGACSAATDMIIALAPTIAHLESLPPRQANTIFRLAVTAPDSSEELKTALREWSDCLILSRPEYYPQLLQDLTEPVTQQSLIGVDFADLRRMFTSGNGCARYQSGPGQSILLRGTLPDYLTQHFDAFCSNQHISLMPVMTIQSTTRLEEFNIVANYFNEKRSARWNMFLTRDAHAYEPMRVGCFIVE